LGPLSAPRTLAGPKAGFGPLARVGPASRQSQGPLPHERLFAGGPTCELPQRSASQREAQATRSPQRFPDVGVGVPGRVSAPRFGRGARGGRLSGSGRCWDAADDDVRDRQVQLAA
jgi:hypothetical protein